VVGRGWKFLKSDNGSSWNIEKEFGDVSALSMAAGNNYFVIVGYSGMIKIAKYAKQSKPLDKIPPSVKKANIKNNSKNISLKINFNIQYNESLLKGTKYNYISLYDSNKNKVPLSVSISKYTLKVTPKKKLTASKSYTFEIPSGALKDSNNNLTVKSFKVNFKTSTK
jgi:hypothetical protein